MLVTQNQFVTLRSFKGSQLMQWAPNQLQSLQWNRELRDVSKCTFQVDTMFDAAGELPGVAPWVHWIDVWSSDWNPELYWSGPIQKFTCNQFGAQISAVDVSALLARTRVPLTKSWNGVDPSIPAAALWEAMLQLHGLPNIEPVVRTDPYGDRFDAELVGDKKMCDKVIQELETNGLKWTVVAGVPLLGPMPREPIASLDQNDFLEQGLQLTRDGSSTYNDILVLGPDALANARTDLYGLNLQKIVTVDNMFGLTNVNSAAQQYVKSVGAIKTHIEVPPDSRLNPNVNLTASQLVPSARLAVSAFGVRLRMELESMQVSVQSGSSSVQVTLKEVPTWTEIGAMLDSGDQTSSVQSGTRTTMGT